MRLTAGWLAQWLAQGDYCSIALGENCLILDSQTETEEIPFDEWDGAIAVHRGVMWGSFEITSADQEYCWTIHGLPWRYCKSFANMLLEAYRNWAQGRVEKLDSLLPEMLKRIDTFTSQDAYLRESDHRRLHHFLDQSLASTGLTRELAASFRPLAFDKVEPWLEGNGEWVDTSNEKWLEKEAEKWSSWFDKFESSPLNPSQREAVLINQDHNLVLAGAGTGKTSVLVARAGYLVANQLAQPEEILMLAFGRKAAEEMSERLAAKVNNNIKVATFHSLGTQIIKAVEGEMPSVSPLTLDEKARTDWLAGVLKEQWENDTSARRWQKHLTQWRIPGFKAENSMEKQARSEQLINWVWRHIELIGQRGANKSQLSDSIEQHSQDTAKPRMKSELALLWPCYRAYEQYLKTHKQIDFNTMIQRATEYVKEGKFVPTWRFIMVDEYQDISPHRLALIEALCHSKQAAQKPTLFAVGDDWQAIYRFAGADVNLTTGFEKRFGACHMTELETTYRFNSMIGEVANAFIQQNPNQLKKSLTSFKKQKRKAVTLLCQDLIDQELAQLASQHSEPVTTLLLARNNNQRPEKLKQWQEKWPQLGLTFMTCHASKGREGDYVFVLDVNRGVFPAPDRDTGLAACLQARGESFTDAEERRLFYVALTRAKKHVWVCAEPEKTSPFVNELIDDNYPVVNKIKRVKAKQK
ncbi:MULTISPECIES: DNA helicase IV [Photobacterium]|uniref:DNA 3'-5' helicase n=1 Tax=Photobacterium ganghwense TaxID=320778 RepID=A0A0J1HIR8_9GAMM|nr:MULTISPECIES: DNA helicase IV [Photobacterium]KLV11485.1 DNA helicase IV [Photobacterium ganghwense]MBV1843174.1 DNA helicase IV [Photobacterium ganghwense]PSU08341.1 DNA helicase IV [Photobacterium ganghwense]QSV15148.1 DNA helicase IV [Photobacterium ganghwense]